MYHSLLAASFIVARVAADTTTPNFANPSSNFNGDQSVDLSKIPVIQVPCAQLYIPVSERELAEMAMTYNKSIKADLNTLSDKRQAVICQKGPLNALCSLKSCAVASPAQNAPKPVDPYPTCSDCLEFTPDDSQQGGTLGKQNFPSIQCDQNYNFNQTAQNNPNLCGTQDKIYSCKTCTGLTTCARCYDVAKLPSTGP